MSSSHGMKCSLAAVQQRHISAADKIYLKSNFIIGPHVIITWGDFQPASCTAETYISRGQDIFQITFHYRTPCHFHTGRCAAGQLYSRDIYQPRTKPISNYILLQDPMSSSHGVKFSMPSVQQRHLSASDEKYLNRFSLQDHLSRGKV